jgi:hypothetical protein
VHRKPLRASGGDGPGERIQSRCSQGEVRGCFKCKDGFPKRRRGEDADNVRRLHFQRREADARGLVDGFKRNQTWHRAASVACLQRMRSWARVRAQNQGSMSHRNVAPCRRFYATQADTPTHTMIPKSFHSMESLTEELHQRGVT